LLKSGDNGKQRSEVRDKKGTSTGCSCTCTFSTRVAESLLGHRVDSSKQPPRQLRSSRQGGSLAERWPMGAALANRVHDRSEDDSLCCRTSIFQSPRHPVFAGYKTLSHSCLLFRTPGLGVISVPPGNSSIVPRTPNICIFCSLHYCNCCVPLYIVLMAS
jgi:hypothetical protein